MPPDCWAKLVHLAKAEAGALARLLGGEERIEHLADDVRLVFLLPLSAQGDHDLVWTPSVLVAATGFHVLHVDREESALRAWHRAH